MVTVGDIIKLRYVIFSFTDMKKITSEALVVKTFIY